MLIIFSDNDDVDRKKHGTEELELSSPGICMSLANPLILLLSCDAVKRIAPESPRNRLSLQEARTTSFPLLISNPTNDL